MQAQTKEETPAQPSLEEVIDVPVDLAAEETKAAPSDHVSAYEGPGTLNEIKEEVDGQETAKLPLPPSKLHQVQ